MFTLEDIEREIDKVSERMKGTQYGPDVYFNVLLERLKTFVPRWRVSLKGGTAYVYVHAMSSDVAVQKAKGTLLTEDPDDLEVDSAEDFGEQDQT